MCCFCTCKKLSIINKGFNIEAPSVSQVQMELKVEGIRRINEKNKLMELKN
uniref:Uncharacterized protein n=1 Tax=Helianthus annuus TaxID=4232 RepID=A0A251V005_HELAN